MTKIELGGGKLRALRNSKEWRNLSGDNLVLVMFCEIEEKEEQLEKMRQTINNVLGVIERDFHGEARHIYGTLQEAIRNE